MCHCHLTESVVAPSAPLVLQPLSHIHVSVCVEHGAFAVTHARPPLAFIAITILVEIDTKTLRERQEHQVRRRNEQHMVQTAVHNAVAHETIETWMQWSAEG